MVVVWDHSGEDGWSGWGLRGFCTIPEHSCDFNGGYRASLRLRPGSPQHARCPRRGLGPEIWSWWTWKRPVPDVKKGDNAPANEEPRKGKKGKKGWGKGRWWALLTQILRFGHHMIEWLIFSATCWAASQRVRGTRRPGSGVQCWYGGRAEDYNRLGGLMQGTEESMLGKDQIFSQGQTFGVRPRRRYRLTPGA